MTEVYRMIAIAEVSVDLDLTNMFPIYPHFEGPYFVDPQLQLYRGPTEESDLPKITAHIDTDARNTIWAGWLSKTLHDKRHAPKRPDLPAATIRNVPSASQLHDTYGGDLRKGRYLYFTEDTLVHILANSQQQTKTSEV